MRIKNQILPIALQRDVPPKSPTGIRLYKQLQWEDAEFELMLKCRTRYVDKENIRDKFMKIAAEIGVELRGNSVLFSDSKLGVWMVRKSIGSAVRKVGALVKDTRFELMMKYKVVTDFADIAAQQFISNLKEAIRLEQGIIDIAGNTHLKTLCPAIIPSAGRLVTAESPGGGSALDMLLQCEAVRAYIGNAYVWQTTPSLTLSVTQK